MPEGPRVRVDLISKRSEQTLALDEVSLEVGSGLLRGRLPAVCVPHGGHRDDRTFRAGGGAALGDLDAGGRKPWFFIANISTAPNSAVARGLSFFPLTSPVTMMLRLGNTDVPAADILISLAIDTVAIVLVMRAASRIFRAAALMQGKRATLPEFLKWFKAA